MKQANKKSEKGKKSIGIAGGFFMRFSIKQLACFFTLKFGYSVPTRLARLGIAEAKSQALYSVNRRKFRNLLDDYRDFLYNIFIRRTIS